MIEKIANFSKNIGFDKFGSFDPLIINFVRKYLPILSILPRYDAFYKVLFRKIFIIFNICSIHEPHIRLFIRSKRYLILYCTPTEKMNRRLFEK